MTAKRPNRRRDLGGERARLFEVFARRDSAEPLTHVGTIDAPNPVLAEARARFVYDEHRWQELCLVPQEAIIAVTGRDAEVPVKEV